MERGGAITVATNTNEQHDKSLSSMERLALWVTDHVGTFGFFLMIFGWTVVWLSWNLLAPSRLRFDPAPAFVVWLFISNLVQIMLMPLIMVGQNLQARHAELRAEAEFETTQMLEREVADMQGDLHRIQEKLEKVEALLERVCR